MADVFTPLTSGSIPAGSTSFRPRVVTAQQGAAHYSALHAKPSGGIAGTCPAAEAVVTPQREGDRVVGVRIQCTCGQVIELAFTL